MSTKRDRIRFLNVKGMTILQKTAQEVEQIQKLFHMDEVPTLLQTLLMDVYQVRQV